MYTELVMRYPKEYFEAFALNSIGAWYPLKSYPDSRMYHPYIESENLDAESYNVNYVSIESQSLLPAVDAGVQYLYGWHVEHFDDVPIINFFSRFGTYWFLLLFLLAYCIYAKRWKMLVLLIPCFAVCLTVFLGPVVLFRYVAPVVFVAPLLLASLFEHGKTDELSLLA